MYSTRHTMEQQQMCALARCPLDAMVLHCIELHGDRANKKNTMYKLRVGEFDANGQKGRRGEAHLVSLERGC